MLTAIALLRVAEEGAAAGREGQAVLRGDAAVGGALVLGVLVAEGQGGGRAGRDGHHRVDGARRRSTSWRKLLECSGHRVEPPRHGVARLVAQVHGAAHLAVAARREVRLRDAAEHRLLGDAVDHAAGAAAAEDHAAGALQDLDAFEVVQVAEDLRVVAHAIDVEVRRGAVAAQHDLSRLPSPWCSVAPGT
jgi:hypothetical protein